MAAKICFFLLLLTIIVRAEDDDDERKRYDGDKVLSVVPSTLQHQAWLRDIYLNGDSAIYDFWTEPAGLNVPVDIHVNKDFVADFESKLEAANLSYSVTIEDVQNLIDSVEGDVGSRRRRRESAISIVGSFARYDDMVAFLNETCQSYSTVATCGSIGSSYEGRDLPYVEFHTSSSSPSDFSKQKIYIEAGIHSREWLASATAIFLIDKLAKAYESDDTTRKMLDKYDFIIAPIINPDGYEYSQISERMWRKTRSKSTSSDSCVGVDANRNYDIFWGSSGSSSNPCSDIYNGPKPFSEPETLALSTFLNERKDNILAFFTLHTYSQLWTIPYGDKKGNYCPDFSELLRVARIGVDALIAVDKQRWEAGNTVDVLDAAAGGGDDWAKSIGIKYSYTLELRPSGYAGSGFVVAESQIDPSGREIWAGIMAAVEAMQTDRNVTTLNNKDTSKTPTSSVTNLTTKLLITKWVFVIFLLSIIVVFY